MDSKAKENGTANADSNWFSFRKHSLVVVVVVVVVVVFFVFVFCFFTVIETPQIIKQPNTRLPE